MDLVPPKLMDWVLEMVHLWAVWKQLAAWEQGREA